MGELPIKISMMRASLAENKLGGFLFRGVDYFSWATGGASSALLLTSEEGIAQALVTKMGAWVLTTNIERERLSHQIPPEFELVAFPWQTYSEDCEEFVKRESGGAIACDREGRLPDDLVAAKRRLLPEEISRYRRLTSDAEAAMEETLSRASSDWTEQELAGEGARALWKRGIHPALTLAAGEERVVKDRHPFPGPSRLKEKAMLVFCGRREGLYANLSRFCFFREQTAEEKELFEKLSTVEKTAWEFSRPGNRLCDVYEEIKKAYARVGLKGEEENHHQGGTTGYLAREIIATPSTADVLAENTAVAWNPSAPGAKREDTVIISTNGLENLTRKSR